MNFDDFPDDVFYEIFSKMNPTQLLGVERINQRWQRLVRETLERRVKTLVMTHDRLKVSFFPDKCDHLKDTRRTMSLKKMFDCVLQKEHASSYFMLFNQRLLTSSGKKFFTSCLAKLTGLLCIDFDHQYINVQILVQAFELCPNLECVCIGQRIILNNGTLNEEDWTNFVDRFGHRLRHISIVSMYNSEQLFLILARSLSSKNLRLEMIEIEFRRIAEDVFTPLEQIQKPNATVRIEFDYFINEQILFGDRIDYLKANLLLWNSLPEDSQRLFYLTFNEHEPFFNSPDQFKPINFSGLKKLLIKSIGNLLLILIRCQFPVLKELSVSFFSWPENVFDIDQQLDHLFQKMPTLTKIKMADHIRHHHQLPGPSFLRLNNLTEIKWRVYIRLDWNLQLLISGFDVVEQLSSLKKLAFKYEFNWERTIEEQNHWREAIEQRLAVLKERRPQLVIRLDD